MEISTKSTMKIGNKSKSFKLTYWIYLTSEELTLSELKYVENIFLGIKNRQYLLVWYHSSNIAIPFLITKHSLSVHRLCLVMRKGMAMLREWYHTGRYCLFLIPRKIFSTCFSSNNVNSSFVKWIQYVSLKDFDLFPIFMVDLVDISIVYNDFMIIN